MSSKCLMAELHGWKPVPFEAIFSKEFFLLFGWTIDLTSIATQKPEIPVADDLDNLISSSEQSTGEEGFLCSTNA
jgi:hypothetical protein